MDKIEEKSFILRLQIDCMSMVCFKKRIRVGLKEMKKREKLSEELF